MKKFVFALIMAILLSTNAQAETSNFVSDYEKELANCLENYKQQQKQCSETWSMKCYNLLTKINQNARLCYKNTATTILTKFYNLSNKEAQTKIDQYVSFIYNEYLFVYNNTDYCVENNCGVSPYLYSEYTTTQELYEYVYKMIKSVSAHN